MSKMEKTTNKYIYAYDKILKRRTVFVVKNGYAISLVTGFKFRYGGKRGIVWRRKRQKKRFG